MNSLQSFCMNAFSKGMNPHPIAISKNKNKNNKTMLILWWASAFYMKEKLFLKNRKKKNCFCLNFIHIDKDKIFNNNDQGKNYNLNKSVYKGTAELILWWASGITLQHQWIKTRIPFPKKKEQKANTKTKTIQNDFFLTKNFFCFLFK